MWVNCMIVDDIATIGAPMLPVLRAKASFILYSPACIPRSPALADWADIAYDDPPAPPLQSLPVATKRPTSRLAHFPSIEGHCSWILENPDEAGTVN